MPISKRLVTLLVLLVSAAPLAVLASAQSTPLKPVTGQFVLQRMHDSYAGKWYQTLTFTQQTTRYRPDGTPMVQTWYESMRYTPGFGTQLRIDVGELKFGRGMLYTADSVVPITAGKPGTSRAEGNEFIPLIQGVYMQPVPKTAAELTRLGFDLTKGYQSVFEGLPVWVVGVATPDDTSGSRFVIDTERRVLLYIVLVKSRHSTHVHVGNYVRLGGGWLATRIEIVARGLPVQTEEYSDWKIDLPLPDALFDVKQWSTAPHWAKKPWQRGRR
ncbi:MAG: hypothetical protein ABI120_06295 [Gemmatimonadaceae bacterium]